MYYSKLREAIFHLHVSNILISFSGRNNTAFSFTRKKRNKDQLFILSPEFEISMLFYQLNIHHSCFCTREAALQMKH